MLVLLTAAARAGIVTPRFHWLAHRRQIGAERYRPCLQLSARALEVGQRGGDAGKLSENFITRRRHIGSGRAFSDESLTPSAFLSLKAPVCSPGA